MLHRLSLFSVVLLTLLSGFGCLDCRSHAGEPPRFGIVTDIQYADKDTGRCSPLPDIPAET